MNKKYVWVVTYNREVWKIFLSEKSARNEVARMENKIMVNGASVGFACSAYRVTK